MNMQAAVNLYQQTAIKSTPPERLLIMVYDAEIKFLNLAITAIEQGQNEEANKNLLKSQEILNELMVDLDMDFEVSHNLFRLYEYFKARLIEANIKKDVNPVQEVLQHVSGLRDTWVEAAVLAKKEAAGRTGFAG